MMDIVRSQVIEMIAIQAASIYSTGKRTTWDAFTAQFEVKPTYEENWFWNNFSDMVDEAVMNLIGAVEGWVTVEYESDIADIIEGYDIRIVHTRKGE